MTTARPSVSIVVPAYNEEANLDVVLAAAVAELRSRGTAYEVIVTDDASTDRTCDLVHSWSKRDPHIVLIELGANLGANASLQVGMRNATGDLIFFIPGDRQVMPDQLRRMETALDRADYVIGWRRRRSDPLSRRLMAGLYNLAVRATFGIRVHDVDSVILVRRAVIQAIDAELTSANDFLPVERLVRARAHGFRIAEVEIEHHPRVAGSPASIKPAAVLQTLVAMVRNLRRLRRVDRDARLRRTF